MKHESLVLKGNPLGDSTDRDIYVYLPPNYSQQESRLYPSVYVLAGFTGRGRMLLNDSAFTPNFAERMDRLINSGKIKPMIAVFPDCFTFYGGSQYINSTATGRYEDYLTQEIVSFIDSNFRTIPDRNFRAVMGKSSGGYGALIMAMRHSNIFGIACSISGDCYFEMCYLPDFPKAFRAIKGEPEKLVQKFWNEEERKSKADFEGLNIIAMSACYSPNGTSFDLPFDLETGEIRQDVWERWLSNDPVRLVEKYAESLASLRLLFIDAGLRDEFNLDIGARVLSKRLSRLGVPHIHEEFDDGHFNISYRYNRSLQLISEVLDTQ
ncbi:MAG: esterase family protein [Pyrinomonadaceae bacterium]|nr:esterase family protein [Pyrinomonadaceae bacterium]MCX7639484.1 esterase family protein [Pyrinomonadaceae bacterium]MDW8304465.1 alpha/beta hydrolase-fold protein [Acidobacteriota bacterium]